MMRFHRRTGDSKVSSEDVIRERMFCLAFFDSTDNGKTLITKAYLIEYMVQVREIAIERNYYML